VSLAPGGGIHAEAETPAGWRARLELGFAPRAGCTVLANKRQCGPLTVQRPFYPEGDVCHLYLLHPPGGVVGGDRLEIELRVAAGARALVTTPGAAKFYRSAGATAIQRQRLRVADGGLLEWFPQENILFPGAMLRSRTDIELTADARFIGWELHSLGRPVIGERFTSGSADLGFALRRDGRPLQMDRLRVLQQGDLDRASGLRGFPVCGTFVATGACARDLDAAREALPERTDFPVGLTLVNDLLIARCLVTAIEPVKRIFSLLWGILRPRLAGRVACPPRIWAT
jgi:urease accessory protein